MRWHRRLTLWMVLGALSWLAPTAAETRYHQHCAKAKGSQGAVKVLAATYLGGKGAEELIAAGWAPNGDILAVGNAWGPEFPDEPTPIVVGEDRFTPAQVLADPEKLRLDYRNPNIAGFVARSSPDLSRLVSVTRFGWGMAMAGSALVARDGAVYLSGRCSPEARRLAEAAGLTRHTVSAPADVETSGADLYLARLSPGVELPDWVVIFEAAEGWSSHWERRMGNANHLGIRLGERSDGSLALVAFNRLYTLTQDGATLEQVSSTRGGVLLMVDPSDDSVYLGGDENTNTGREPWRRPFLTKYDRAGEVVWEGWRWNSRTVGEDKYRLVSDSGVYGVTLSGDDEEFVWGWSDGGNSVFSRQPRSLDQPVPMKGSFIDSLWGANVGKFSWLMRLDREKRQVLQGGNWCSFRVDKNKPNSSAISDAVVLDDGRIAFVGSSSWAFVETPDAWVRTFPEGSGGTYFAVLSEDLRDLLFASLLPSCGGPVRLATRGTQALIACRANPPAENMPSLLVNAVQADFGGLVDGYLLLADTASEAE
ncbi:MAG: hypothetical protein ACE5R4_17295 [Armatimonadota bacterium]